jgi:hypothetical protein
MSQFPVPPTAEQVFQEILNYTPAAIEDVNALTIQAFQTRGGRIGSGLGGVIEALWGFYVNKRLTEANYGAEFAWISGHEYNDFAAILRDTDWEPSTGAGELLRVEVKSMVRAADESKAHFDRLKKELTPTDILAVFLWNWVGVSGTSKRSYPKIIDAFVGRAAEVAELRDALHIARGGSFVESKSCPDGCKVIPCTHDGEPLNASGVRERKSGPEKTRRGKVSFAANFGGLKRMIGTRGAAAKAVFTEYSKKGNDASKYIAFIVRNFRGEETLGEASP